MKILFILPPFRRRAHVLPLGPAYITSMLLKHGHSVTVVDVDVFGYTRDELMLLFKKLDYDIVTMGGMAAAYKFVKNTAADIKDIRPDVKIISGGHMVTPQPELLLKNSKVDIGVIGEGELTMVELLDSLAKNKPLSQVDGIAFKENSGIITTRPRDVIKDLDTLPFPAWDHFFAKEIYARSALFPYQPTKRSMNISTGRGCPYECTFCSYDRRVRLRSADSIISELEELKQKYRTQSFSIQDNLFMVNRERVVEFCNKLIKSKLKMSWLTSGRVNLVDKELLNLLGRAGCVMIGYGIESGSPKMLNRMKKHITPKQIEDAMHWTAEAGIVPSGTWILGMPGEDKETIKETLSLYKKINRDRHYFKPLFFATPFPGTELYEEMKTLGKIGNEDRYMDRLSDTKAATTFLINCTTAFSDNELIILKKEMESVLLKDLHRKHRLAYTSKTLFKATGLQKLINILIEIKMYGVIFILRKILSKITKKPSYIKPYI